MYSTAICPMPAGWPLNYGNPLLRGVSAVATFDENAGNPRNWVNGSESTISGVGSSFTQTGTAYGPGIKLVARTAIGFNGASVPTTAPVTMAFIGAFDRTQLGSEDGRLLASSDIEPGGITLVYNTVQTAGWGVLKNGLGWLSVTGSMPVPTVNGLVAAALVLNANWTTSVYVFDYTTGKYGVGTSSNTTALTSAGTGRWGINQERGSGGGFASTFTPTYNLAMFLRTTWTAQDFQSFVERPYQIYSPQRNYWLAGSTSTTYFLWNSEVEEDFNVLTY